MINLRDSHSRRILSDGAEPVGFAYGGPLSAGREWWREHMDSAPAADATFAPSEPMVRPTRRKKGISQQPHNALLEDRSEDLVVLLVDPGHPRVQNLDESWGYHQIGYRQPFADSPRYAVMLCRLPL
ncbi:GNAT family N-acetyltransferase [Kitasatospora sp. NPDC086791]|uniref:GNAT family N-acetyltransferase n=1 Tax=Kitasatospora sp. NPDC086791 TaxID=3155178 RepID=UPI00343C5319